MIRVLIILFTFSICLDLNATHIVGGNLTYKYLGNEQFEIRLRVQRDCKLGSNEAYFDDPASIGIYDENGALISDIPGIGLSIVIEYNKSDTINFRREGNCNMIGETVCVEETTYKRTIRLPRRPGGYILSYQRCCRNATLQNILDPLETGANYFTIISEDIYDIGNSSPVFNFWPDVYYCTNDTFTIDNSAFDFDGDSLSYRVYQPLSGASIDNPKPQPAVFFDNSLVEFIAPWSWNQPILPYFDIDEKTGLITALCPIIGQFLIGVEVLEYRDGKLIGRSIRDYQINVRPCLSKEFYQVEGAFYFDENQNKEKDGNEPDFPFIPEVVSENCLVEIDGSKFSISSLSDQMTFKSPRENFQFCNTENQISYDLSSLDLSQGLNVPIWAKNNFIEPDVYIESIGNQCGEQIIRDVIVINPNSSPLTGVLQLSEFENFEFITSTFPHTNNGDLIEFNVELKPLETLSIPIEINVEDISQINQAISARIILMTNSEDFSYSFHDNLICNSSENQISVTPNRIPNGGILQDESILVRIDFENVGFDISEPVTIVQYPDENIDLSSLQLISSSHPVNYQIDHDGIIRFLFNDIQERRGYLVYKINPKIDLEIGTEISHQGYIYFGSNSIPTNTFISTIIGTSNLNEEEKDEIEIYPNPTSGIIYFKNLNHQFSRASLFTSVGALIREVNLLDQTQFNISDLDSGIYILNVYSKEGNQLQKTVKIIKH